MYSIPVPAPLSGSPADSIAQIRDVQRQIAAALPLAQAEPYDDSQRVQELIANLPLEYAPLVSTQDYPDVDTLGEALQNHWTSFYEHRAKDVAAIKPDLQRDDNRRDLGDRGVRGGRGDKRGEKFKPSDCLLCGDENHRTFKCPNREVGMKAARAATAKVNAKHSVAAAAAADTHAPAALAADDAIAAAATPPQVLYNGYNICGLAVASTQLDLATSDSISLLYGHLRMKSMRYGSALSTRRFITIYLSIYLKSREYICS